MDEKHVAPLSAKRSAVGIIEAEHAAYEAALSAIVAKLGLARVHGFAPEPGLFERSLSILATFMDSFHHPKEDEFLFKAVRERTREADDTLAELQHEHARGPAEFRKLKLALARTRRGASSQFDDFAELMARYARAQFEHMRLENDVLMPIAVRVVRTSDWKVIDEAFRANRDPLFGRGGGSRQDILSGRSSGI